uniref:Metalloendopeptidase n=1 Tax=Romanomermis culicivorax TaxID=13658 RepID=A0A915IW44_ROMCU
MRNGFYASGTATGIDRIEFINGDGCSSFVGKTGGTQEISLKNPGCDSVGIASHEIGHSLGFFHEQGRPDQPSNVQVNYANVLPSRKDNFVPMPLKDVNTYNLPYEYGTLGIQIRKPKVGTMCIKVDPWTAPAFPISIEALTQNIKYNIEAHDTLEQLNTTATRITNNVRTVQTIDQIIRILSNQLQAQQLQVQGKIKEKAQVTKA